MSDTLNCYTYLHENIPRWNENLSALHTQMSRQPREHELVAVRRNNDSTESIRPEKMPIEHQSTDPLAPSTTLVQDSSSPSTPLSPAAKRKRNAPSMLTFSGPCRYRVRSMVVIYYDSDLQKAFENLVRGIGIARNQIRKGRNAARLEAMASLTTSFEADDDGSPTAMAKLGPQFGLAGYRSTRSMGLRNGPTSCNGSQKLYDSMDSILEKAQALCERAAHQCLRDGNALAEIERTKSQFQELYQLCDRELARRKEEAEKAAREKPAEPENMMVLEEKPVDTGPTAPSFERIVSPTMPTNKILPTIGLEVDDSMDDDEPIILPPIRLTSRA